MRLIIILLLLPAALLARDRTIDAGRLGLPAGGYSGLTYLGADRYAAVSDRGGRLLFFQMTPDAKAITDVREVVLPLTDLEDVALDTRRHRLWITSEGEQRIVECDTDGQLTGRELAIPPRYGTDSIRANRGFEALCYDSLRDCLWTTTEAALLKDADECVDFLAFSPQRPHEAPARYTYHIDPPQYKREGRGHYHGVAALAPWTDGRLLVMEREARIARHYQGSRCRTKLYAFDPATGQKTLLRAFTTRLGLLTLAFANYEGMTVTPEGLLLIADSQERYGRALWHLRDYIRVCKIR